MPDYTLYDVSVSLLTPMHIGNGRELLNEYDYAIHKGKTWRINENALLDAQDVDDLRLARQLAQSAPADLIEAGEYQDDSALFRYVLTGAPRSSAQGARLNEQIKDPYDRPYLPGSSLKGALRTAIAWYAWEQNGLQPDLRQLGRGKKWAGQTYERQLLGKNPNHDLLKALQVSDSQPGAIDRLMVLNVRILNGAGNLSGSPVEMEAIRPDTTFNLSLKLDHALFSEWARRGGLRLNGRALLENLPAVVQAHSLDRARREATWFASMPATRNIAGFFQQLIGAKLSANRFLIDLGWGTGWEDKTFGSRLQEDERFMERIISDYRLTRGRRQHGDPFPKSRRVAVSFKRLPDGRMQETPATPLGWALVEIKERK